LILALLPCLSFAGSHSVSVTRGPAAAGGITYLVNQNFEGTGYDNSETWTSSGTVYPDYTTTPLRGSQDLRLVNADSNAKSPVVSSATTVYGRFMVDFAVLPAGTTRFFGLYNGATRIGEIAQQITGRITGVITGCTQFYAAAGYAMSVGTPYYIWWAYTNNGGTGSTLEIWQSTDSTKPGTSIGSCANGTTSTDTNAVRFETNSSMDFEIDQVLMSTSVIGSGDAP